MRNYLAHSGSALAVLAASVLAIGCGDKEEKGADGTKSSEEGKAPKREQPTKAPAPPVDLESEMVGYWAPNVPSMVEQFREEIGDDPQGAEMIPEITAMMGMMSVEFQKGEVTIHGPDGEDTATYKLKSTDAATRTLTMDVTNDKGTMEGSAKLDGDKLYLSKGDDTLILDRIDEENFKARRAAADAALTNPGDPVPGGGGEAPTPPVPTPPVPVPPSE